MRGSSPARSSPPPPSLTLPFDACGSPRPLPAAPARSAGPSFLAPETLAGDHRGDRARDPQEAPSPSHDASSSVPPRGRPWSHPPSLPPRHGNRAGQHRSKEVQPRQGMGCLDLIW